MRFEEFNLCDGLLEAISFMGFEKASPIQEKAIPEILNHRDILAFAQTGTGKTAAFVLPVLHQMAQHPGSHTSTLILVPTRELAIQIEQQIQGFAYYVPVNSIAIYGGGDGAGWSQEARALSNNTDIVVATPGKLIAHLNQGTVKLNQLKYLVLDEADRMLDMGFHDDIQRIISYLPKAGRQTMMFSATMPPKIKKLAEKILHNPVQIAIELSKPAEGVEQSVYLAYEAQKKQLVNEIIAERPDYQSILVFTSTKAKVSQIVSGIKGKGFWVEGISSDLEQKKREEVLAGFRSRKTRVLVATDVLSRGIDIKEIALIINFDVPHDAEDYVHRVGRTARADAKGEAITLVSPDDIHRYKRIERLIGSEIPQKALPVSLGDAPSWDDKVRSQPRRPSRDHSSKTEKQPSRKFYGRRKKQKPNSQS